MTEISSPEASSPCENSCEHPDSCRGLFISFEGTDGVGKTTQCRLLCEALRQLDFKVITPHEPGGTVIGDQIRHLLLTDFHEDMDAMCELFLYEAARAQLVSRVIQPALNQGICVVCDRFIDSTTAYQGFGRHLGQPLVEQLNRIACQGILPDRTLLLDLNPAEALRRATAAAGPDRMEAEGPAFETAVHAGFICAQQENNERICLIDASGSIQEVWQQIRAALNDIPLLHDRLPGICPEISHDD